MNREKVPFSDERGNFLEGSVVLVGMELWLNDELVQNPASEEAVESSLRALRRARKGTLDLFRTERLWIRVDRWPEGLFLSMQEGGLLESHSSEPLEESKVLSSLVEFLRTGVPRWPTAEG